jgi:hypothetical protein
MITETLDVKGAADLLHCSHNMVRDMAARGEIPATYIAGQWLFLRSQLLDDLAARARQEQAKRREEVQAASMGLPMPEPDAERRTRGSRRRKPIDISGLLGAPVVTGRSEEN